MNKYKLSVDAFNRTHEQTISEDAIKDKLVGTITTDDYSGNNVLDVILKEDLDDAPTIIEADTESEESSADSN